MPTKTRSIALTFGHIFLDNLHCRRCSSRIYSLSIPFFQNLKRSNPKVCEWSQKTRTRQRASTWIPLAWRFLDLAPSPQSPLPPPLRRRPPPVPPTTLPRRSANHTLLPSLGRLDWTRARQIPWSPSTVKHNYLFIYFSCSKCSEWNVWLNWGMVLRYIYMGAGNVVTYE